MTRESFKEEIARMKRERVARSKAVADALAETNAIVINETELLVLTPEMSDAAGGWRLTSFMKDGPWGHDTRPTVEALVDEVADRHPSSVRAISIDEVDAWMSTPEFQSGAKRVAFIQAANALTYARVQDYGGIVDRAHRLYATDPDAAIAMVQRALPRGNPSRSSVSGAFGELAGSMLDLVTNPAWVTKAVGTRLETIRDGVPAKYMPRLSDVRVHRGRLSGRLRELGCGAYGCVLPTLDDRVVMKITTDTTEAEFAADLASTLVVPICVTYHTVMRTSSMHDGRPVFFLWREAADEVGQLKSKAIEVQHRAAQQVYAETFHKGAADPASVQVWRDAVREMGRDERLVFLAQGLLKVYDEQGIFFGDIHHGNIGLVLRSGIPYWVITDPGHVSVTT